MEHFPLVGRLSKEPRLAGKVCVVSGASRGFGQAIAIRFVEEGAKVVCLSRSGCEETLRLISTIDGLSGCRKGGSYQPQVRYIERG